MPFSLAGQLAQQAPVVQADAPLGLVAENLRASSGGVVAVLDRVTPDKTSNSQRDARIIGIVTQEDLARATQRVFGPVLEPVALNGHGGNGHIEIPEAGEESPVPLVAAPTPQSPLETLQELRARDVMHGEVPFVPAQFSLANALLTFDRVGLGTLPVLDESNRYLGMISRADVLSALAGYIRPPVVGGMATPLGVWLTDGVLNGGAPTIGLFLSGLGIAGRYVLSLVVVYFLARSLDPSWGASVLSGRLGMQSDPTGLLNTVFFFLHALLLLLFFRITPLAGVHAAEHQTVHALERGLPLTVENVSKMPRAHPRCGTNLMAIAGLILVGVTHLPSLSPDNILIVLLVTFFAWRSFGDVLQVVFTTRPASKKQIESGIKAANELMAAYQAQPFALSRSPLKLLNRGMLWAGAGAILGQVVLLYGLDLLARLLNWT
ncbi:hypothetical protein IAD21_02941 [Abditibacteriota bacterium]|nr:hypothetical protein IAD21_02941 [Abditibacteriota bacterium]